MQKTLINFYKPQVQTAPTKHLKNDKKTRKIATISAQNRRKNIFNNFGVKISLKKQHTNTIQILWIVKIHGVPELRLSATIRIFLKSLDALISLERLTILKHH